jgi:two-component system nitrate/nitrite response regulator NarL
MSVIERPADPPTARQREIIVLAVQGLSNRQIAERLSIAEGTVKIHLHNIYNRFGLPNRAALAAHWWRIAVDQVR